MWSARRWRKVPQASQASPIKADKQTITVRERLLGSDEEMKGAGYSTVIENVH